ncbi:MAG: prepilin-type N-terminal cleavage/methylation domain-containing protein, partial [Nitrospirae bacterium]
MNHRGVTLIELIVVLAIAGILLGLAAPPFFSWLGESRLENNALQLYSDLKWAQSVAQEQGEVGISQQANAGFTTAQALKRRVFIAIEPDDGGYRIYRWQDEDSDGLYDPGEFDP